MLKRQQCASIPILSSKQRKSITFHIAKRHIRRHTLKITSDFNSQLLSNQNSQDFTNLVSSIKHIPKPEAHKQEERISSDRHDDAPPLKIIRYSTIKTYEVAGEEEKVHRYSTQPAFSLSPSHFKMLYPPKQIFPERQSFKRYQSPTNQRKLQLARMLPQLQAKRFDQLAETANVSTGEIIKPWETRRDLFHETFKRYIADHNRRSKWPSLGKSLPPS